MSRRHALIYSGVLFVCCVLLGLFVWRTDTFVFDAFIQSAILTLRTPMRTMFFLYVSELVGPFALTLFALLAAFILARAGRIRDMFVFLVALCAGGLLHVFIKFLVEESRPTESIYLFSGWSYPSGHATMATVFFFMILSLFFNTIDRAWLRFVVASACVVFVVLVGFSRIYLGAHFATDVLGGYLLGLSIVYFSRLFVRRVIR